MDYLQYIQKKIQGTLIMCDYNKCKHSKIKDKSHLRLFTSYSIINLRPEINTQYFVYPVEGNRCSLHKSRSLYICMRQRNKDGGL